MDCHAAMTLFLHGDHLNSPSNTVLWCANGLPAPRVAIITTATTGLHY